MVKPWLSTETQNVLPFCLPLFAIVVKLLFQSNQDFSMFGPANLWKDLGFVIIFYPLVNQQKAIENGPFSSLSFLLAVAISYSKIDPASPAVMAGFVQSVFQRYLVRHSVSQVASLHLGVCGWWSWYHGCFHSHGGTPLSLDGLFQGKPFIYKWMITRVVPP